jgi:hypothetical protein
MKIYPPHRLAIRTTHGGKETVGKGSVMCMMNKTRRSLNQLKMTKVLLFCVVRAAGNNAQLLDCDPRHLVHC